VKINIGKASVIIPITQHLTVQVYMKIKLVKRIVKIFIFESFLQAQIVTFALQLLFNNNNSVHFSNFQIPKANLS